MQMAQSLKHNQHVYRKQLLLTNVDLNKTQVTLTTLRELTAATQRQADHRTWQQLSILRQEQALYTRKNSADFFRIEATEFNKKELPRLWRKVQTVETALQKRLNTYHDKLLNKAQVNEAKWKQANKEIDKQVEDLEYELKKHRRHRDDLIDTFKEEMNQLDKELWMERQRRDAAKVAQKETLESNKLET